MAWCFDFPRGLRGGMVGLGLTFLLQPAPVGAQIFESLGTRALGMGGAFVGVADDATAVYWNPAGLATGATFDLTVGYGINEQVRIRHVWSDPPEAATSGSATFLGFVVPSFGLSYYRLRMSEVSPPPDPTAEGSADRQDHRNLGVVLSSLVTDQLGVTLVQSLLDGVVVGATMRLVRGIAAVQPVVAQGPPETLVGDAGRLVGQASTTGDLDAGVMANVGSFRVGVVARNLFEPRFEAGPATVRVHRQVRLGAAMTPGRPAADLATDERGLVVAFDLDVTRTPAAAGDRRNAAVGVERWFLRRRVGVRGGARANTVGEARPVATGGVTVGVPGGVLVEGEIRRGSRDADRGWSVTGRLTF